MATRKARYSSGRKSVSLKGKPLTPNASVASRYERSLRRLIAQMTNEVMLGVRALFADPHPADTFALDASLVTQAEHLLTGLQFKFGNLFATHSKSLALNMLQDNSDASESQIKSSMSELAEGLSLNTGAITAELGDVFKASVAENVALIKSIPSKYLDQVNGEVYRSISNGNGLSDLVPALRKYKMITERRARLIAHDQVRKSFANINRIRLSKMGVKKFEWVHSFGDTTPRPLHLNVLNGKVFLMSDPPIIDTKTGERGFPGQLINCKCRMRPIINFDED